MIQTIEAAINKKLQDVAPYPDALSAIMRIKKEQPKYCFEGENLVGLNLAYTKLTNTQWTEIQNDPNFDVRKLKALNLTGNLLTELYFSADFEALEQLEVADCEALTQLSFETALPHLSRLTVRDNKQLNKLVLPTGFEQLKHLEVSRNALQSLELEGDFPTLEWVDASNNQIESLFFRDSIPALEYLTAYNNQIQSFSFIHTLTSLNILDLRSNQLKDLPNNLLTCQTLEVLQVHNNPFGGISEELVGSEENNAWPAIKAYLKSRSKGQMLPLREAKMVLVGNGMVGKTSIRYCLIDKNKTTEEKRPLPTDDERTELLEVEQLQLKNLPKPLTGLEQQIDFKLNIWDYGGQGYYREIQQLFCSKKTLYLYVTSLDDSPNKEDYVGFSYWLSMVHAYSYDEQEQKASPIIFIWNKIDNAQLKDAALASERHREYGEAKRQGFDSVCRNLKISSKTGYQFSDLEQAIAEDLSTISKDIFQVEYADTWLEVKEKLERLKDEGIDHLSMEVYSYEICGDQLTADEAVDWLKVLDQIGTIKYFGEDAALKNWIILNPEWLRRQILKVIIGKSKKGGLLSEEFLRLKWGEDWKKMMQVCHYFRLCYTQKNDFEETEYVFPARLHQKAPKLPHDINENPDYVLCFEFSPFIPAGIVNKLMVELYEQISREEYKWLNNFIIGSDAQGFAHIAEDWKNKKVLINLYGKQAYPLLSSIQTKLEEIKQWFIQKLMMHQLKTELKVKHDEHWYSIKQLKSFQLSNYEWLWGIDKLVGEVQLDDSRGLVLNGLRKKKRDVPTQIVENIDHSPQDRPKRTILFLAANPTNTTRIQTDKEHRIIKSEMGRGEHRQNFDFLPPQFAVTIGELLRAMNAQPNIIHFSGHGLKEGIAITKEDNTSQLLPNSALKRLFKRLKGICDLVILNSCYSAAQAEIISSFGMYVVGHNLPIGDSAAISFAKGFYLGLGEGKRVEAAYDDAMIIVETEASNSEAIIEIWKDGKKLNI